MLFRKIANEIGEVDRIRLAYTAGMLLRQVANEPDEVKLIHFTEFVCYQK